MVINLYTEKEMQCIERAYDIAKKYCTAPRRGGKPAMSHIDNVVMILGKMGITHWLAVTTAILHDVIEDCHDVDPNDDSATKDVENLAVGSKYVSDAVKILTHPPEEPYAQYIDRILKSENYAALVVKIADIIDNVTSDPFEHSKKKYKKSLPILIGRLRAEERVWGIDVGTEYRGIG
jgi:(p)ppGpp synthase/HD superfamily hydrolase